MSTKKRTVAALLAISKSSAKLGKAIERCDKRGYTGFLGSKGGAFDDPKVKAAMRDYSKALKR